MLEATTLLRAGLLEGVGVVIAGPPPPHAELADAIAGGAADVGATVARLTLDADEDATQAAVASLPSIAGTPVLVCDAAGALAAERAPGDGAAEESAALTDAMAGVWNAIRAVASPVPERASGRLVTVAPPPDGSPAADAARAALENLARTLSVEWARHGITVVSIAPGASTTKQDVAALVAYLASPAGAYYSGCQLDLRGVAG